MSSNGDQDPGDLDVGPPSWLRWSWVPVLVVLVAVCVWWIGHPQQLPTQDSKVTATAKAGSTVYLGVEAGHRARTLSVESVTIPEPSTEVTLQAWICVDGALAQTTDATRFCADVVPAEGQDLRLGTDQLILSVSSDIAQEVEVGRLTVSYSEGLQRAEQPVGASYAVEFIG